jgi:hypothetical protein
MLIILALLLGLSDESTAGFQLLFDGKTLAHWNSIKERPDADSWHVRRGAITCNKGGGWLATDDTYYDFVLRLEYRTRRGGSGGILLRASQSGNPAFTGLKLQISNDAGKPPGLHSTGAVFGAVAPARNMALPAGKWNRVEITLIKSQLAAVWNGERILEVNLEDPKFQDAEERPLSERAPFGHIGLQVSPGGAPVEFRNIRLKVLKAGPSFPANK